MPTFNIKESLNEMHDAMIDLESMGVTNQPALVQISAVQFNPFTGKMGSTFDRTIDLKSSMDAGLDVSAGTLKFWLTDPGAKDAQDIIMKSTRDHDQSNPEDSLQSVLIAFASWCKENEIWYVHGNGTASDNIWLRSAYTATHLDAPFTFRDDMCYRTIRTLCKRTGWEQNTPFEGVVHNGIDDAKHQVRVLSSMMEHLGMSAQTPVQTEA